jgi:hypothetical protein
MTQLFVAPFFSYQLSQDLMADCRNQLCFLALKAVPQASHWLKVVAYEIAHQVQWCTLD